MEYLWLIGGFILLIVGADIFVEGSSSIAKLLKIPSIIIGLTVVAFGTSMPEASVSINAALAGENSIAVRNVVGSNIFNLLVVLGASALICPVHTNETAIKKEIPFSIITTVVLGVLLCLGVSFAAEAAEATGFFAKIGSAGFTLGRIGGVVLLVLFALYMFWQISGALKARKAGGESDETEESKASSPMMAPRSSARYRYRGLLRRYVGRRQQDSEMEHRRRKRRRGKSVKNKRSDHPRMVRSFFMEGIKI